MKALFFDIDGTLIDGLRGIHEIPATVVAQLERLHDAGHKLIICSGRPWAMIDSSLRLPLFDAYVMCNGGHVKADGKTLHADLMNQALVRSYVELFDELGMEYMLQTAHHIYLDRRFAHIQRFFADFGQPDIFTFEFDREDAIRRTIKLETHATGLDAARMRAAVEGRAAYTAHMDGNGGYNAFEVFSPTTSKAVGVELLLSHYGIAQQQEPRLRRRHQRPRDDLRGRHRRRHG